MQRTQTKEKEEEEEEEEKVKRLDVLSFPFVSFSLSCKYHKVAFNLLHLHVSYSPNVRKVAEIHTEIRLSPTSVFLS